MPTENRSSNTEMVSVPRELTPAMREAFHESYEAYEDGSGKCPDSQWRAMLLAAPQPSKLRQERCDTCNGLGEVATGTATHHGYNQPPEPDLEVCPECSGEQRWYVAGDIDRLVRELDVLLNGDGAAPQAKLCDLVAQVAAPKKHQGEPVALPVRKSYEESFSVHGQGQIMGWNACLDEIAKLGPLYTRPAPAEQQEPVAWIVYTPGSYAPGPKAILRNKYNVESPDFWANGEPPRNAEITRLYTAPPAAPDLCEVVLDILKAAVNIPDGLYARAKFLASNPAPADPGEVERLQLEIEKLRLSLTLSDDALIQDGFVRIENRALRSRIDEQNELLREIKNARDWNGSYRALEKRIDAALSASAEPSAPVERDDFWSWLDSAYRDGSEGESPKFTKYNMEVAYRAGQARAALERTP